MDLRIAEGLVKLLAGGHTPTAKRLHKKITTAFAARERQVLRGQAPTDSGKLKKAVKSRSTRSGGAAVYVDKRKAPHFYFVEAGTKERQTKKGAKRGKVNAKPWIAPWRKAAHARYKSEVLEPLVGELKAAITKGLKL